MAKLKVDLTPQRTGVLAGYLSEQELAIQLNVHTRTIWNWRRLGKGPPVSVFGRQSLFQN